MFAARLAPVLTRMGIHYGWVMVGLTFLVMLATAATMGSPGVFIDPLHAEFGWETAAISGPLGLRFALGCVARCRRFGVGLLAR